MAEYRRLLRYFPNVSSLKIRYQTLEIINNEACIFANIVSHTLAPNEYNMSLQQVINSLQPTSASYWVSPAEINNQVLLCTATVKYRDIVRFKALGERQKAEAASENAVVVTRNDLASISKVEDVISVASKICSDITVKYDGEYHTSFEYHVIEHAILDVNGWECLRVVDGRVIPVESNEWLVMHKNKLFQEFPWITAFDPGNGLLEYGLKLLTLVPTANRNAELRRRMLSKSLRRRTSEAINRNSDLGHVFCIAILLIGIYQCKNDL